MRAAISRRRAACDVACLADLWDVIHYLCPLSRLEAVVLIERYVNGYGERELASKLDVNWRTLNRATWRMKAKLRECADVVYQISCDARD